ncbi:hypothetical protein Bbelb_345310 [Branchiostoma belcheri]|nr:hypothetical protein Bbelb_345310 [Branchiostoma belcheri]
MKGLALVLILSSLTVRTSCSENVTDCAPCTCQPDVQGTVDVDCSGLGLTELPHNIPNNTAYLGFKYNNLTTLDLDKLCKLRLLEGGIVKTLTVPSDQCVDGTWTLQVSEGITCNTEYNVRVTGDTDTDQGPSSDTICLVTVGPGHVGGPREDDTEYVRDFWIIGHEKDQSRIEKLCKALEKHHDLTGGTDYRDCTGGDSVFDNLENAISTSKIIIVVLSNNTKGGWVKYKIQTVRHCLMDTNEEEQQTSRRLIPVRLTRCGKPHCLQTLETLDVWDKYFWRKLLATFNKGSCNEDDRTTETAPLVRNNGPHVV